MSKRITLTLTDDEYERLLVLTAGSGMRISTVAVEMLVNSVDAAFNLLEIVQGRPVGDNEALARAQHLMVVPPIGTA